MAYMKGLIGGAGPCSNELVRPRLKPAASPFFSVDDKTRGPKDHINKRISHFGSKTQQKGDARKFEWSLLGPQRILQDPKYFTVKSRSLEHDRPSTSNQRNKDNQHKSSYIHVSTCLNLLYTTMICRFWACTVMHSLHHQHLRLDRQQ